MINCRQNWGSVRKVRYLDDIDAAVNYALQSDGEPFSENAFVSNLIESREIRHNFVQKHYRKGISRTKRSMYQTRFSVTLPDTLVFLREMRILSVANGTVKALELAEKTRRALDEAEKRKLVLEYALNSKYKAYTCFLKHLIRVKRFVVPRIYFKRNTELREFLREKGFLTDTASFYTLRDLFYELDVVNWYVDEKDDVVLYPTVSSSAGDQSNWSAHVRTGNISLHLRRKMDERLFTRDLVETYLNLTRRRFLVNADLLELRDIFCDRYKMGDHQFRDLLVKNLTRKDVPYDISLNFGSILKQKKNYDLKIVSLPRVSPDRLALYITIEVKETA